MTTFRVHYSVDGEKLTKDLSVENPKTAEEKIRAENKDKRVFIHKTKVVR